LGLRADALWEVQWHPSGGGRVRRLVLTRRGLRRVAVAVGFLLLLVLAIVGILPIGLRGFLSSFTVDAARRENRALRLRGDELREAERRAASLTIERVQRARRVAWVLGADPRVWRPACPPFPAPAAGDEPASRWLLEQGQRLEGLGDAVAAPPAALPCPLPSVPFAAPVNLQKAVPTALFGWRISPFTGKNAAHYGTTLAAPLGEQVLAPGAGKVLFAGSAHERRANEWTRFGNLVILDHGGGVVTVFAHLRDVAVRRAQAVTRGQLLGRVGQTGWTRVPALYYEVRWPLAAGSTPVDPGLVTPTLPVEDLDARLVDPTAGLPDGFARLDHLVGTAGGKASRASRAAERGRATPVNP
jgi:murein DD-endopeptidase MepM/ murein hydrolase activator NlpD